MLLILSIITLTAVGGFLLALVSDAFAYELSRVVEAVFDLIEHRLALQARRRGERQPRERVAYAASFANAR